LATLKVVIRHYLIAPLSAPAKIKNPRVNPKIIPIQLALSILNSFLKLFNIFYALLIEKAIEGARHPLKEVIINCKT
jgi:hypothetical protein